MVDTIDLTNYTLLDAYGLERRKLEGNYSKRTLAQLFIDEWLPWYDCYDICPRSEYCKFPESNTTGIAEIPCGIVVEAIRNFVGVTFQSLNTFTKKQIQGYLDGAYYLTNFLFDAELNIGRAMDANYIRSLKDWAPAQFGRLANLRENLDSLSAAFAVIPEFQSYKGILLVEGESEKAFIETLKQSHGISYLYLNVDTYQGKSNRGHPKLRLLLQRYVSQGYIPYIQGDADGKATNIFDALIQKSPIIKKENTFVFKYDFETAVPRPITYIALKSMGHLTNISVEEFVHSTQGSEYNIFEQIKRSFDLDLQNEKIDFAHAVANTLNHSHGWGNNGKFRQSELGKFLSFISKIHSF